MQERNKGQAGMGGRGKNQKKGRQDVATRRRTKAPSVPKAKVAGRRNSTNPKKANQKNNQREWHAERMFKIKKTNRAPNPD